MSDKPNFFTWDGDVNPTLGRKAMFNIGEQEIATREIPSSDGSVTRVQRQGNLARITKTESLLAQECVPGPLTEVSRTYHTTERIYSTERTMFIDRKRLKTLVMNNGVEDITLCFASPLESAQSVGTGKCFVEKSYGSREYYDDELACANNPATPPYKPGTMYAEFLIKRIKSITFTYRKREFKYKFAYPVDTDLDALPGAVCANQNSTEAYYLSRVINASGVMTGTTMSTDLKSLELSLTFLAGFMGPAEYLKGSMAKFWDYNGQHIGELSEIIMFGQAWHGKYVATPISGGSLATTGILKNSAGAVLLPTSVPNHNYSMHYQHPEASTPSNPEWLTALGGGFLSRGYVFNTEGNVVGTGTLPTPMFTSWVFAKTGGGGVRMEAEVFSSTTNATTIRLRQYGEIEYGNDYLPTPAIITSLVLTHGRGATAHIGAVAPSSDGHKVLLTLWADGYTARAFSVHEITIAPDLSTTSETRLWVETNEYVTPVALQAASTSTSNYSWPAGTWSGTHNAWVQKTQITVHSEQYYEINKNLFFCLAAYTKDGVARIVTAERVTGGADRLGVWCSGYVRDDTGEWVSTISTAYDMPAAVWPAGSAAEMGSILSPGSYGSASFNEVPQAGFPVSMKLIGVGGGDVTILRGDAGVDNAMFNFNGQAVNPNLWEVRSVLPSVTSLPVAVSYLRVAPDVVEHTNQNCRKYSTLQYGLNYPNWNYDAYNSAIIHDCSAVI